MWLSLGKMRRPNQGLGLHKCLAVDRAIRTCPNLPKTRCHEGCHCLYTDWLHGTAFHAREVLLLQKTSASQLSPIISLRHHIQTLPPTTPLVSVRVAEPGIVCVENCMHGLKIVF